MSVTDKRYYWLKLKRDFFKRHDIQIIEDMPNGKDYILFYLKLLCESIDHDGCLRFSEKIPYNEQMLSTITRTNVDIVRSAVKMFSELGMMEVMDDGTYYMNEVQKMLGSETYWAQKKREKREIEKAEPPLLENVQPMSNESPTCPSKRIEKDKEKELDKDIDNIGAFSPEKTPARKRFIKPTLQEVIDYCNQRGNNVDAHKWYNHYESNGWKVGKNAMKDWKASVRTWERSSYDKPTQQKPEHGASRLMQMIKDGVFDE